jgi:hypothetical protein
MTIRTTHIAVWAIAFALVGSFLAARPTQAATQGSVIINEFLTKPSVGQEWYEIFNTTTSPI